MKYLHSTETHDVFEDLYHGNPVRFLKNRTTGEVLLSGEDIAKCHGFNSLNEMIMSNPELMNMFLDGLNSGTVEAL